MGHAVATCFRRGKVTTPSRKQLPKQRLQRRTKAAETYLNDG